MPPHAHRALSSSNPASGFLVLRLWLALLNCLLLGLTLQAQEPASGQNKNTPDVLEVNSLSEYWSLNTEQRQQPIPFRIECVVTFYEHLWKQLWVQDAEAAAFAYPGEHPLPLKFGQRILATGISPAGTLSFENATITLLSDEQVVSKPIGERLEDTLQFTDKFVTLDAVVDRQEAFENNRLHLYLSYEGRLVYAWLLYTPGQPAPDLRNKFVRIKGVYAPKLTPSGLLSDLDLMIADPSLIEVISPLSEDSRFNLPRTSVGDLPRIQGRTLVRINGRVVSQDPGHSVRIRDDTGQVDILSAQTLPCPINAEIQVIGHPRVMGTDWKITQATYRLLPEGSASTLPVNPSQIRISAQVRELTPEQASRGIPVHLNGVITWSDPNSPFLFLQDSSGGICIYKGTDKNKLRPPGRNVEVHGATSMGSFAPVVIASSIVKLGDIILPEAKPILLEHAMTGIEEGQWVEMRGFVRKISLTPPWKHIELATGTGYFTALLPEAQELPALEGSLIRVRGVCNAETNERRQLTGVRLWVPNAAAIQIEDPAPARPFDIPTSPLASLGQFGVLQSSSHRVKVSGIVLHQVPGRYLHIQEGTECLEILTRETNPVQIGDRVEAVGFMGHQGRQLVLREAIYRKIRSETPPAPTPLVDLNVLNPSLMSHLVKVEAVLIDATSAGNHTRMTLQEDKHFFEALMDSELPGALADTCKPGSRLALTGIYELRTDEHGQASHFLLQLRSPADIQVLAAAPWLTRSKILAVAGVLALFGLFVVGWVVLLRRRIRLQTGQIRRQLQREARLQDELQRASRLESLGILAGGIAHDFNNLLTVVMGNLSLALLDDGLHPESSSGLKDAIKAVNRARDLTLQLLTFSKGGSPIRSTVDLPELVQEVTRFALHGSHVRCEFSMQEDLWAADVDKGQISQVIQNIVINAVQAMPGGGTLSLSLSNEQIAEGNPMLAPGAYLHLSIHDTGVGIQSEHLSRIFDPYFTTKSKGTGIGLATVYSIIRKHLGHISVESKLGEGTCFRIWLPAATGLKPAEHSPQPSESLPKLTGRVLLMDDEEGIRRLGLSMMERLGLEATTVVDGTAALEEFLQAKNDNRPYDLIILDLTVPGGMGGLQTLEQLRRIDPHVKAIVSSGYSNDQTLADHLAAGFVGMVSKPYEIHDLARTLTRILPCLPPDGGDVL